MEVLGILLVAALIGGAVWYFFIRDNDESPAEQPAPTPAPQPEPPQPAPSPILEEPVDRFSVNELEKLTKAEIEKLGEENGVKLDRRKNKMGMIDDLRAKLDK